jgi:hypothetical protein
MDPEHNRQCDIKHETVAAVIQRMMNYDMPMFDMKAMNAALAKEHPSSCELAIILLDEIRCLYSLGQRDAEMSRHDKRMSHGAFCLSLLLVLAIAAAEAKASA